MRGGAGIERELVSRVDQRIMMVCAHGENG